MHTSKFRGRKVIFLSKSTHESLAQRWHTFEANRGLEYVYICHLVLSTHRLIQIKNYKKIQHRACLLEDRIR